MFAFEVSPCPFGPSFVEGAQLHCGQQLRFGACSQQFPVSWSNQTDFWTPNPAKPSGGGYFSFISDKMGLVRRGHLLSTSSPLFCSPSPPRRDLWSPLGSFGETGRVELAKSRGWQKRDFFFFEGKTLGWSQLLLQNKKFTWEMLWMPNPWEILEFSLCYGHVCISEEHLTSCMLIGSYNTIHSGWLPYLCLYLWK